MLIVSLRQPTTMPDEASQPPEPERQKTPDEERIAEIMVLLKRIRAIW
jgi:hypothetical protein